MTTADLDQTTLDQIRNLGGDALLGKLVRMYLENTPLRLEEIRRGLQQGDLSRTELASHSLRSSSVTLGAVEVAATAASLEKMARSGDTQGVGRALPELDETVTAACAVLSALIETDS